MISLVLLLQADSDIPSAYNRYEDIQPGRSELFMRQVDMAFGLLRNNPQIGKRYTKSYRRCLIRASPYGIFYEAQPTRIIVGAVIDLRSDPETIRRKLGL
jgi:plasmid stabilization system protein ParE